LLEQDSQAEFVKIVSVCLNRNTLTKTRVGKTHRTKEGLERARFVTGAKATSCRHLGQLGEISKRVMSPIITYGTQGRLDDRSTA
jgi:hypothetical protein